MDNEYLNDSNEFEILEEQGYDLEQFLCRCPNKTSPEINKEILKSEFAKDPIAVVTLTLINPDTMIVIRTRAVTSTLGLLLDGLKNIDQLKDILPRDPIAALYVLLTNNFDKHKTQREVAEFAANAGLIL